MPGGPADDAHAEIRQIIQSNLSELKEWLDTRLQQQERLLRAFETSSTSGHEPKAPEFASESSEAKPSKSVVFAESSEGEQESEASTDINVFNGPSHQAHRVSEFSEFEFQEGTQLRSGAIAEVQSQESSSIQEVLDGQVQDFTLPGAALEESTVCTKNVLSTCEVKLQKSPPTSPPEVDDDIRKPAELEQKIWTRNLTSSKSITEIGDGKWCSKLMDIFDQLDLDKSGSIDRNEFMEAFDAVGMPPLRAQSVFRAIDRTQNGEVDRIQWLHIIEEAGRDSSADEMDGLLDFMERLAKRQKTRGRIYDSTRNRKPFLILMHNSILRMIWDLLMMMLLFYIAISMPYGLGFGQSKTLDTVDRVFDMFFCCDVVLNFRTSYVDRDENIIIDGCKIAKKYLKSWFTLDFVSSVPFDLITAGLMPNLTPARLLKIGKIAKVMKLLRISKVLTVFEDTELMEKVDEKSTSRAHQTFVRIAKLVALAFLVAHLLACFEAAIDTAALDVYFADEEATNGQKYIASMYWAMTTLSTVGYGDITPKTDNERAYAMFAMIIGGALYGYVIGSVTAIVTDMDLNARAFHDRMELIQSWLDRHNEIPKPLRRRLRKHFKRVLAAKSAIDDSAVVGDLSPELRADTAFFLIHERVRTNPMFRTVPNAALAQLVHVLQKNHSSAEEFIVKAGDPGIAMFILIEGGARYNEGVKWKPATSKDKPMEQFAALKTGDSFGEEILFGLEETYSYSIVTTTHCVFHSISEDGFQERFANLPELRDLMHSSFLKSRGSSLEAEKKAAAIARHAKGDDDDDKNILNTMAKTATLGQAPVRTIVKLNNRTRVRNKRRM